MDFNLGFGQVKVVKTQPYYLLKNLNIVTFISYLSYIRLLHVTYMVTIWIMWNYATDIIHCI